jgi:hypothetical protein
MAGTGAFLAVVVKKNPDNSFQTGCSAGFLDTKQGQVGGTARSAKDSSRVGGIKVPGNGENNGNNIVFFQTITGQNLVVEEDRLSLNIISPVKTPGSSPQRIESFHRLFLPYPLSPGMAHPT